MIKEMPIPRGAIENGKAQEILRVWMVGDNHQMHVSIDVTAFVDSRCWGIALADLARHVANSYEDLGVAEREKVLTSIVNFFEAEIGKPTSEITTKRERPV